MDNQNNLSSTFAMDESTSPSLLQDIIFEKAPESNADVDDSCDSSSDIAKADSADGTHCDFQVESGSESQVDFAEVGMRNSASSGLTMKEYEEQLKKLTAENFNLKLRVYFVEERLSKVTGINDKEDLIKKNIQLQVACESQLKELEKKQELLFEASKAFELLQKEHSAEIEKLSKEKDREISDWEEKFVRLETHYNEIKSRFPVLENLNNPEVEIKTFEEYEKQVADLKGALNAEIDRNKEMENILKDTQLELESYELKVQRIESELDQRMHRVEELVDELEQKEHDLASANFRIRKQEDDLKSKQREIDITKERVEEKNKTIESLKQSLAARYDTIESLESKIAKERSSLQSMQSKLDGLSFQNVKLKEELEILQSRLRRTTESLSPRGKGRLPEDEATKHKYEEVLRAAGEQEIQFNKRIKELEEKLGQKNAEADEYQGLLEKHKKLEIDHRKACTALKNFIKRSTDEKKEREVLNHMLSNHEEVIADLKAQLDRYRNNGVPRTVEEDKLSLAETGDNRGYARLETLGKPTCRSSRKEPGMHVSQPAVEVVMHDPLIETRGNEEEGISPDRESKKECTFTLELKSRAKGATAPNIGVKSDGEESSALRKGDDVPLQESRCSEPRDENRQPENSENHSLEMIMNEAKSSEAISSRHEADSGTDELSLLENKLLPGCEGNTEFSSLLECELLLSVDLAENCHGAADKAVEEKNAWSLSMTGENSEASKNEEVSTPAESARAEAANVARDNFQTSAADVYLLLSLRLEELVVFFDNLLANGQALDGVSVRECEDIKQTLEKSRELSRRLSRSFPPLSGALIQCTSREDSLKDAGSDVSSSLALQNSVGNFGLAGSSDKIIAEQTLIINRLRGHLKTLNQEIRQRDIEISRCQDTTRDKVFEGGTTNASRNGDEIEKPTVSAVQKSMDDSGDENLDAANTPRSGKNRANESVEELSASAKSCKKIPFFLGHEMALKESRSHETSDSEAWSEPDRSVSLARMGVLDGIGTSVPHCDNHHLDSTGSSEETINSTSKYAGKRLRLGESEIRRLQAKINALEEANERLRAELSFLKKDAVTNRDASNMEAESEDVNLSEKLRKTMDRLNECNLSCRRLEEKLAEALQRAAASAVQLTKAAETISDLERQIDRLKEELNTKTEETEKKNQRIVSLESALEEMTMESELKLREANRQREAAERKTLEVECRLKDAENMSKEVESKVKEIEKKMCETNEFKRETALHFKEAERQVEAAEKMMEEARKMKVEADRKSKDFQNFIDLMRKEVEDKLKEAERRIKKSEKEKEEMESLIFKLKNRLMEAENNKTEVETKVKEGKETIRCMEEKLKELEVAMDQCNEEAQRKIKEMQAKAEVKVAELGKKMEERERARKAEVEKKMAEAQKISRELETGFRRQLEEAEKRVNAAREVAEAAVKKAQEDFRKQEENLKMKIANVESAKKRECADLLRKLDEAKLEASEFELELTRLTNEKIQLEEELKKALDNRESNLCFKENKQAAEKYETSIHKLEEKLTRLSLNKSQLASRLEEIESTNIDLVTRLCAITEKETAIGDRGSTAASPSTPSTPSLHLTACPVAAFFSDAGDFGDVGDRNFFQQGLAASDPGDRGPGITSSEAFALRRHMNSSPDLGIDSDPGRFSSLEPQRPAGSEFLGSSEPLEIKKLELENAELRRRLTRTRQALEETLTQLSAANQRKKQVERAICKQLHKTHHILRKARVNFECQDGADSLD